MTTRHYKIAATSLLFVSLLLGVFGCGDDKEVTGEAAFKKLGEKNKFVRVEGDKDAVKITQNVLEGKWTMRVALRHKDPVKYVDTFWLGTAETELKTSGDNLFFKSFTFTHVIEPEVNESGFSREKVAGTSRVIIPSPQRVMIPQNFDSQRNMIRKATDVKGNLAGKDKDYVLEFKLDFTGDKDVSYVANGVTKGLIWVSRDANTFVASNGNDVYLIAQKNESIVDASLASLRGDWEAVGYSYFASLNNITADPRITTFTVDNGSSDLAATFKGVDGFGRKFSGNAFMPNKTMGASMMEIDGTNNEGGFLISPDGKYIYGVTFGDYHQFVAVRK